jgi:hypothetical protein
MLSWLLRGRNKEKSARSAGPKRVRLTLECLENRYCPSGPQITSFSATVMSGNTVQLSGMVSDPGATSVSLTFQGAASATTTATNGSFSLTVAETTPGTVYVQATDNSNLVSPQASAQMPAAAPTITFTVSQDGQHNVTVSGQVTDQSPGSLTVTLSGVVTGSATTSSTGAFSWTGTATSLGQVNGAVTDSAGLTGNGTAQLTNAAPSITNFQVSYSATDSTWLFTGKVNDEYAAGLTVTLTNIPGVGTATVTVGCDDCFSYTDVAPQTATNTVSASVTDWWGAVSATVTVTM